MRRSTGTARGIAAGFLGLIALHAVGSNGGSGRVAEFFGDLASIVERVMDPDVPAIPDRSAPVSGQERHGVPKSELKPPEPPGRLPIPEPPKPPKTK